MWTKTVFENQVVFEKIGADGETLLRIALNSDEGQNIETSGDWQLPPPPVSVTMRQARLALLNAGLLTTVNNTIQNMTGSQGDAARIEWEYAQTVDRSSPLVTSLAATLNLSSQDLDNLFRNAAEL